jgi:hypothetical protein
MLGVKWHGQRSGRGQLSDAILGCIPSGPPADGADS